MAELCAPNAPTDTMQRIAQVESSGNPYAIGVVGARLARQPASLAEAVATAEALEAEGYNYSLGLVQVNRKNLMRYGLSLATAFDPCRNLRAGAAIFEDCYHRAGLSPAQLSDALSCYYSGDFVTGYKLGYVARVQAAAGRTSTPGIGIRPQPSMSLQSKDANGSEGPSDAPSEGSAQASLFVNQAAETRTQPTPAPKSPATALLF